jgi:hypothetical protein
MLTVSLKARPRRKVFPPSWWAVKSAITPLAQKHGYYIGQMSSHSISKGIRAASQACVAARRSFRAPSSGRSAMSMTDARAGDGLLMLNSDFHSDHIIGNVGFLRLLFDFTDLINFTPDADSNLKMHRSISLPS